ncbi:hypothetical protein [Undibacterium sp. TJN19]|uniref:hypothetical protein n=1 Tax=Undibacterium sp. TJN19 TaxID=3413055 RepID=UPI003BF42168
MANKALATRQRMQFRVEPSQAFVAKKGGVARTIAAGKTNTGFAIKNSGLSVPGKTTLHKDKK